MPRRGEPLSTEEMGMITTWINEGAKFDGEDPQQSIELAWRMAVAKKSTHEELMNQRMTAAKKNWATGNPDSPAEFVESKDFFIIGDIGMTRLEELKTALEAERTKIGTNLKLPAGQPMVKGASRSTSSTKVSSTKSLLAWPNAASWPTASTPTGCSTISTPTAA